MDQKQSFFTDSKVALEQYIQDRLLLIKLQSVEKVSKLSAALFAGLIMAVLGFFIILFLSIMAGFYFAAVLESNYWGFGIVSAFYILLFILMIVFRKKVFDRFVTNTVIKIFFDQTDTHHEHAHS